MKKYNTIANEMFKEQLSDGLSPTEITKLFISDYYEWRKFAYTESKIDKPDKEWNIGKSYNNLIIKYCGLDKQYQGLAYGSEGDELLVLGNTFMEFLQYLSIGYDDPDSEDFHLTINEIQQRDKVDYSFPTEQMEQYYHDTKKLQTDEGIATLFEGG